MSIVKKIRNKIKSCQPANVVATDGKHLKTLINQHIKNFGNSCALNHIDVSNIISFEGLFQRSNFNGDISKWNTSNVENFSWCFADSDFKGDISNWNVSKAYCFNGCFYGSRFNGDISKWDVSNATNMSSMFQNSSFNADISQWNTSSVIMMTKMFSNSFFNRDISKWNTARVFGMHGMFEFSKFNGDISDWNVNACLDMVHMFEGSEFEGDLSKWKISHLSNHKHFINSDFKGKLPIAILNKLDGYLNWHAVDKILASHAYPLTEIRIKRFQRLNKCPDYFNIETFNEIKHLSTFCDGMDMTVDDKAKYVLSVLTKSNAVEKLNSYHFG